MSWIIPFAALAGLLTGLVMGALGGGGAIITVPVLAFGFGLSVHDATTASLIIVGFSAGASVITHARAHHVDWGRGLIFAAVGSPGAILGSHLAHGLPEKALLLAFGALLLVVAALMLRERVSRKSARGSLKDPRTLATALAAGLLVGLLAGFFGVGGGFAIVPALTLALGLEMPIAVATSLLVIFINSATALATKVGMGIVLNWPLVITFAASMTLGSMFGAKLSAKANPTLLRRSFAWLLVVVAIYTVANAALKAG